MVDLSSCSDRTVIEQFIRQVSNRLWLNTLQCYLGNSVCFCAGLLLLSGIINLYIYPLSLAYCLMLAVCPLIAGAILAGQRKPGYQQAAHYIDSQFKGQSLMSTAAELLVDRQDIQKSGYQGWVISQAALASRQWLPQLNISQPLDKRIWLASVIALSGLFFLLQEAVILPEGSLSTDIVYAENKANAKQQSRSLFAAVQQNQNNSAEQYKLSKPAEQGFAVHQNKPKVDKQSASKEIPNGQTLVNSEPSANLTDAKTAKQANIDAVGTQSGNTQTPRKDEELAQVPVQGIAIGLQEGHYSNSDGASVAFKKQTRFAENSSPVSISGSAMQNKASTYRASFSPRQQQYVEAYFKKHSGQR